MAPPGAAQRRLGGSKHHVTTQGQLYKRQQRLESTAAARTAGSTRRSGCRSPEKFTPRSPSGAGPRLDHVYCCPASISPLHSNECCCYIGTAQQVAMPWSSGVG